MEASWQAIIDSVLYKLVFPSNDKQQPGAVPEEEEQQTIKQ
jgi:hypothetical protein